MNAHARGVLEFREVLEAVASRAASPLGKEAIRSLTPSADLRWVTRELQRVGETLSLLGRRADWAPPPIPDARSPLKTLKVEGGVLSAPDLLLVLRLLSSSRLVGDALEGEDGLLADLRSRLPQLPRVEKTLERVVDEEGELRDDASPALKGIRRGLRDARGKIVRQLERYMASLPERMRVPDASISVRDGRYVVPIRREGKSEVGGVIHGESASGATLFVEPPLALQLMNRVHELERDEAQETQRILREVSGQLRPEVEALRGGQEALVDFDTLWARALTARRWEGSVPELVEPQDGPLRIVRGRHPLLLEAGEGEVVPFDLTLEPEERALVVSGPNTGGKTVFLKSVGLVHLLAQSGIVPPVGPRTRIPMVRDLFADIGDEQSLAASLSTFSAHLANAREILEGAGPGTLVLMDEMGTGTDPSEGAALARAILEVLVERGARTVVTSHLGALKRLDGEGSGIVNSSFLFDSARIEPTYHFRKGRPGRSYGLAIASRLGIPATVLDRAQGYVDSGELEVESLLALLEERERSLAAALSEAEEARTQATTLRADLTRRLREVEAREKSAEERARRDARQLLLDARDEVEEAIRQLRETDGASREEAERQARARVEEAARKQGEGAREAGGGRPRRSGVGAAVAEGARVRIVGSGAKGVVRELREDRVAVEVGGLRMDVALADVEPLEGGGPKPERAPSPTWSAPEVEGSHEADLRGLRVEEVEMELGRALDGAILASLHELRIIHGKGTGAVKARVQELLRRDGRVTDFRPGVHGEGGGGVTVAHLKS